MKTKFRLVTVLLLTLLVTVVTGCTPSIEKDKNSVINIDGYIFHRYLYHDGAGNSDRIYVVTGKLGTTTTINDDSGMVTVTYEVIPAHTNVITNER